MTFLRNTFTSIALAFVLCACGDGSDSSTFDGDFSGTWDLRYNLTLDECAVVEAGVQGFVDTHEIVVSESTVTLDSSLGAGDPFLGTLEGSDRFIASQNLAGDVFGIGIFCTFDQEISYTAVDERRAESVFLRRIVCDDGFLCETRGIGEAVRR